jgi:hypothetical protein
MNIRETGWEDVHCFHVAVPYENGNKPSASIRGGEFLD